MAAAGKSAYDKCYNSAKGAYDVSLGNAIADTPESVMGTQKAGIRRVETLICYIKVSIRDGTGSEIDCAPKADMPVYTCNCNYGGNNVYAHDYATAVSVDAAPDKDTSW